MLGADCLKSSFEENVLGILVDIKSYMCLQCAFCGKESKWYPRLHYEPCQQIRSNEVNLPFYLDPMRVHLKYGI